MPTVQNRIGIRTDRVMEFALRSLGQVMQRVGFLPQPTPRRGGNRLIGPVRFRGSCHSRLSPLLA